MEETKQQINQKQAEKIRFQTEDGAYEELFVLEETKLNGINYLLVTDSEEKEAETLTPYTMEELHARIDRSLADAKAGRVYTNEEMNRFMQEYIEECYK